MAGARPPIRWSGLPPEIGSPRSISKTAPTSTTSSRIGIAGWPTPRTSSDDRGNAGSTRRSSGLVPIRCSTRREAPWATAWSSAPDFGTTPPIGGICNDFPTAAFESWPTLFAATQRPPVSRSPMVPRWKCSPPSVPRFSMPGRRTCPPIVTDSSTPFSSKMEAASCAIPNSTNSMRAISIAPLLGPRTGRSTRSGTR